MILVSQHRRCSGVNVHVQSQGQIPVTPLLYSGAEKGSIFLQSYVPCRQLTQATKNKRAALPFHNTIDPIL